MSQKSSKLQNRTSLLIPRREILRGSAAAAAAATFGFPFILPARAAGANDKIRVASIGAAGKGNSDIDHILAAGGEIVALCDVDKNNLDKKAAEIPGAKLFRDYRKMLEEMDKSI